MNQKSSAVQHGFNLNSYRVTAGLLDTSSAHLADSVPAPREPVPSPESESESCEHNLFGPAQVSNLGQAGPSHFQISSKGQPIYTPEKRNPTIFRVLQAAGQRRQVSWRLGTPGLGVVLRNRICHPLI